MGTSWMLGFFSVVIVTFGVYTFSLGLLGLIKKCPLAFSSKPYLWILLLIFLANLISSSIPLFRPWGQRDAFTTTMPFINLALMIMMIFALSKQMTSYMVFGIYDDTFREALTTTLNKLNMPYLETLSKLRLVELDTDLQVAVTTQMGTAQIRIKQREHAHYIKKIATGLNEYYATASVKVNNLPFIIYLILGILMLIMAVVFINWIVGVSFRF